MDLKEIQKLVRLGKYSVRPDATRHSIKEDFTEENMVYAVLNGKIIEEYPERDRVLIYAQVPVTKQTLIPLHLVCEYWKKRGIVDFVTAYIPEQEEWETPTKRRR